MHVHLLYARTTASSDLITIGPVGTLTFNANPFPVERKRILGRQLRLRFLLYLDN